ncbi:2010_t:CDS:1 [Acaulospora colombiana]|uniref:2010_t:CDS:1 n=1 Tax=Acaulospora colombiana TaxID=27376 RepID=A0ACA9K0J2_9GLOM|nr:2010_t:CDS:1 [Acaulospora colombiana]
MNTDPVTNVKVSDFSVNSFALDLLHEYWDRHGGRPASSGRKYLSLSNLNRCQEGMPHHYNIGSGNHRRNGNSKDRDFILHDKNKVVSVTRRKSKNKCHDSDDTTTRGNLKNRGRVKDWRVNSKTRRDSARKNEREQIKFSDACNTNFYSRLDKKRDESNYNVKKDQENDCDLMAIDTDDGNKPQNHLRNNGVSFRGVDNLHTTRNRSNKDSDSDTTRNPGDVDNSDSDAKGENESASGKVPDKNSEIIAQIEKTMEILWDSIRFSGSSSDEEEDDCEEGSLDGKSYVLTNRRDEEDSWEGKVKSIDCIEKYTELDKLLVFITW